jgi:hypothetical protein
MERSTYGFRTSWWIMLVVWGLLCFWQVIVFVVDAGPASTGGIPLIVETLLFSLYAILCLLMGFLSIGGALSSKIIISPEGIEYHTLAAIVSSSWENVTASVRKESTGENIYIHILNPEIRLRSWTRFAPWDVHKGVKKNGIPLSSFGGSKPNKLVEDIHRFAPQLKIDFK